TPTPTLALHDALPISRPSDVIHRVVLPIDKISDRMVGCSHPRTGGESSARFGGSMSTVFEPAPFDAHADTAGSGEGAFDGTAARSEEHTSELQSPDHL